MSAPAIALTVIGAIAYLFIGLQACGLVELAYSDSGAWPHRWIVHTLALLAIPLWPLPLIGLVLIGVISAAIGA